MIREQNHSNYEQFREFRWCKPSFNFDLLFEFLSDVVFISPAVPPLIDSPLKLIGFHNVLDCCFVHGFPHHVVQGAEKKEEDKNNDNRVGLWHVVGLVESVVLLDARSVRVSQVDVVFFAGEFIIQDLVCLVDLPNSDYHYWNSSVVSSALTLSGWYSRASFRYAFLMSCLEAVLSRPHGTD